jgi:hypothetical protein
MPVSAMELRAPPPRHASRETYRSVAKCYRSARPVLQHGTTRRTSCAPVADAFRFRRGTARATSGSEGLGTRSHCLRRRMEGFAFHSLFAFPMHR